MLLGMKQILVFIIFVFLIYGLLFHSKYFIKTLFSNWGTNLLMFISYEFLFSHLSFIPPNTFQTWQTYKDEIMNHLLIYSLLCFLFSFQIIQNQILI